MRRLKKMEKKNLIKNYLLDESRFKIAWDIWRNFGYILFELKQDTLESFIRKIMDSKEFKDYKVVDFGLLDGKKGESICISKKDWIIEEEEEDEYGVINYALAADQTKIYNLFYGIEKYNENIPFKGDWRDDDTQEELDSKLCNILNKIYDKLGGEEDGWETDGWIAWNWIGLFNKGDLDTHLQLITEEAVNELFNEFVELKNSTEELIDEFVEIYKAKENKS